MDAIKLNTDACTGCGLCASLCPKDAIELKPEWDGFSYPKINTERCISCRLCEQNCPAQKSADDGCATCRDTYAARAKDVSVRRKSSSGGVFYLLAQGVLAQGGVVFGATADSNGEIYHIAVENAQQLDAVLGSKYVQSDFAHVFAKTEKYLSLGKPVLVCGTPCQITAMRRKFGTNPNLCLVDFICHGVGSPSAFRSYLHSKIGDGAVKYLSFRNKDISWSAYSIKIVSDRKRYYRHHRRDDYMAAYLQNLILRRSCYDCRYETAVSDIRLADFWDIGKEVPMQNISDGVSKVFVYTQKGRELLEGIAAQAELCVTEIPADAKRQVSVDFNKRKAFFEELQNSSFDRAVKKYTVQSGFKVRLYKWLKYRWKEMLYR